MPWNMEECEIHNIVERRITLDLGARSCIMCIQQRKSWKNAIHHIWLLGSCNYYVDYRGAENASHVFWKKNIPYSTKIDLLDYALIVFCLSGPPIKHLGQNPQPLPSPTISLYSDISSFFITSPRTISSLFPSGAPAWVIRSLAHSQSVSRSPKLT